MLSVWLRAGTVSVLSVCASCAVSDAEVPADPNPGEIAGQTGAAGVGGTAPASTAGSHSGGAPAQAGGTAPQAGGAAPQAGSFAAAGSSAPVAGSAAGSGGAYSAGSGGSTPAAGSGGLAAVGGAGAPAVDECPSIYTTASHIVLEVSWEGSLATKAGSGQVHMWSKNMFSGERANATIATMSCGSVLPVITTTAIAGGVKILAEIPNDAWKSTAMPTFSGTAIEAEGVMQVKSGSVLLGLTMSDPDAAWPAAASGIQAVDHDGDGKPGITALSRDGGGFKAPPTSLSQSARADRIYLASRNVLEMSSSASGCPESLSGTVTVKSFDNHIVGCHVQGGNECTAAEAKFLDDNRTVFKVKSATFESVTVDAAVNCDAVRAALPAQ